ncbi:MAG: hypothetical protein AAFU60_16835, partial [Bacteroidota bacterium]
MRKISADLIVPVHSDSIEQGVVVIDESGKIEAITPRTEHDPNTVEVYEGVIVPGFVNTHCHLELSHMKAKVNTGTGLIPFISSMACWISSIGISRNCTTELMNGISPVPVFTLAFIC